MTGAEDFEGILRTALLKFSGMAEEAGGRGREREAISFFAFECLLPLVGSPPLVSAGQICIECAVPQVKQGGKQQVCKDLVIWPRPGMTVWNREGQPTNAPSAILEWKVAGYPSPSRQDLTEMTTNDVAWLRSFTAKYEQTRGFAIGINWSTLPKLRAVRVVAGVVDQEWWGQVGAGRGD